MKFPVLFEDLKDTGSGFTTDGEWYLAFISQWTFWKKYSFVEWVQKIGTMAVTSVLIRAKWKEKYSFNSYIDCF